MVPNLPQRVEVLVGQALVCLVQVDLHSHLAHLLRHFVLVFVLVRRLLQRVVVVVEFFGVDKQGFVPFNRQPNLIVNVNLLLLRFFVALQCSVRLLQSHFLLNIYFGANGSRRATKPSTAACLFRK